MEPTFDATTRPRAGQRFQHHQRHAFAARRKNHDIGGGVQRREIGDMAAEIEGGFESELADALFEAFFLRAIAGDDESEIALRPKRRELLGNIGDQQRLLDGIQAPCKQNGLRGIGAERRAVENRSRSTPLRTSRIFSSGIPIASKRSRTDSDIATRRSMSTATSAVAPTWSQASSTEWITSMILISGSSFLMCGIAAYP